MYNASIELITENKNESNRKEINRLYRSKKELKKIDLNTFKEWYYKQNNCCCYCGLTVTESYRLFEKFPESTRGGRRGRRLEIDRINPFITDYGHDINNLTLACYWCNNAKTNYFTYEEFKIIGVAISEIQKERLNNI